MACWPKSKKKKIIPEEAKATHPSKFRIRSKEKFEILRRRVF